MLFEKWVNPTLDTNEQVLSIHGPLGTNVRYTSTKEKKWRINRKDYLPFKSYGYLLLDCGGGGVRSGIENLCHVSIFRYGNHTIDHPKLTPYIGKRPKQAHNCHGILAKGPNEMHTILDYL